MPNRVALTDTTRDVVVKLCEGNPGAINVMMMVLKDGNQIDPDAAPMGGLMTLLRFDDLDIVGPRIWLLYKDVCGSDVTRLMGVMRAAQLGFTTDERVRSAIDFAGCRGGEELKPEDIDDLLARVRERLPRFGAQETKV